MTENNKDIAIVGAGIVGICSALYLQKAGFTVTLYDKAGVGQGASKGNAGHFATEQVFPLADASLLPQLPKMMLDPLGPFRIKFSYLFKALPWFFRFVLNMFPSKFNSNKKALQALNKYAIEAYLPLINAAGNEQLFTRKGSLLISEQKDCRDLKKVYQSFKQHGIAAEFLEQKQLKTIEPNLSEDVQYGIYFTEVGHTVDPEKLCTTLFNLFEQQGGAFKQLPVDSIEHNANSVNIISGSDKLTHDNILIATGAWSKPLAKQLGYSVPLDTERGYHLMVPKLTNALSIPVASLERKFIMTPMEQGLRLAGTVEFAGLHAPANVERAHSLLPHAKALLTNEISDKASELPDWMGFRPSLPDSLPVIGRAPNHNNVYFAFGHQHLGLTQAAITGKLLGELLTEQPTSLDISPFCISRFQ